ncbi:MAG: hypothetical protein QXM22_01805, partial [Candidatus Bathyarchaeia archaeon]
MPVFLSSLFGSASIGVFSLATDNLFIAPCLAPVKRMEKLGKLLKVKTVFTTVGGSVLIGALICANSKGVILPHFVREEEIEPIRSADAELNITVMETKRTAYGNMVLANDYGAIVDPRIKPDIVKQISETLGVE